MDLHLGNMLILLFCWGEDWNHFTQGVFGNTQGSAAWTINRAIFGLNLKTMSGAAIHICALQGDTADQLEISLSILLIVHNEHSFIGLFMNIWNLNVAALVVKARKSVHSLWSSLFSSETFLDLESTANQRGRLTSRHCLGSPNFWRRHQVIDVWLLLLHIGHTFLHL